MEINDRVKQIKTQQDFKGKVDQWDKLCNFLLVVRAVEIYIDSLFSIQEIVDAFKDLQALKIISTKGGLHKPESYSGMVRYLGRLRGKKLTASQSGYIREGQAFSWYNGVKPEFNFVQLKWITGLGNQHWTLGKKESPFNEIYDAWDDEIIKVEIQKRYLLNIKEA